MRTTIHQDIPDSPPEMPDGPYYFVGVGGAGMSAIAQVLAERGAAVAGADPGISRPVKDRLERAGVRVFTQHAAKNLGGAVTVVVSDAVPDDNPEVQTAEAKLLSIVRRPQMLGALTATGRSVAIAGTHGKTTTTGMVSSILLEAGLDPTILIGGDLPLIEGNARNGAGDIVVAEACEAYDGFLYLHPSVAVVTNVEPDHLDYHGTEEHLVASFERFVRQTTGTLVYCADDRRASALEPIATAAGLNTVSYGLQGEPNVTAVDVDLSAQPSFTVRLHNQDLGRVRLKVPGVHNVRNALAAIGVAYALDVPFTDAAHGLGQFTGTGRRFQLIGKGGDITVIDDYAHHPTEIRATLAAARGAYPSSRIVAVFQPHLPSRTRDLMDDFAAAFDDAHMVYVTDIYLAREQPIDGVSSADLAQRIRERNPGLTVTYVPEAKFLPDRLRADIRKGDVVLTMGAGDIWRVAEGLYKGLG